jgi:hypothetical protein
MAAINRRDVVLGVGAAAGLAAAGGGRGLAAAAAGTPDPREVLRRIRLTGAAADDFLARLGRAASAPVPLPPGPGRPAQTVEGRVVTAEAAGRAFAHGLAFTCSPRVLNRFAIGGVPLVAHRFCFSADEVAWAPGRGFPVYAGYAPRYEYAPGAYYREAKAHQLVPVVEGRGYFTGCQPADVCEAPAAGPVGFDVNDTHYDDNDGAYVVTVWSWS